MVFLIYYDPEAFKVSISKEQRLDEIVENVTTVRNVVGLLVSNNENNMWYYVPIAVGSFGVKWEYPMCTFLSSKSSTDLEMIVEKELLITNNTAIHHLNVYKGRELIHQIKFVDSINEIFYDGQKYLYVVMPSRIAKVDINNFQKKIVVSKEMLEEIDIKYIAYLNKIESKWFILALHEVGSYILYTTPDLENMKRWDKVFYFFEDEHDVIAVFNFLPDNSLISSVYGNYLSIDRLPIKGFEEYEEEIWDFKVLPINSNTVAVIYTFEKGVHCALLKKEKDEWYIAKQRKMLNEPFGFPIKIVTREAFEGVLKPYLYVKI